MTERIVEVQLPALPPMIIDKPLRSGQQVYARGRDLVVLAMVSHGAEVIADGHIHVYAPLRGQAIAGAKGNTEARIFTTCMEAATALDRRHLPHQRSARARRRGGPSRPRCAWSAAPDGSKRSMHRA